MPILTQVNSTKFRSLKYGGDRLNGGSSNQPYIQTPIPEDSPGTGGPDSLLRGGTLLPVRIARDVSRLTQMFTDTRSLNGLLFTTKQEMLGLSEVNMAAGYNGVKSLLNLNSKLYLPTSTIAQAAITPLGQHISKQGVIPANISETLFGSILKLDEESRVENLYKEHIIQSSTLAPVLSTDILYSYSGGPGSVGGVGVTNIKLSKDRTGINSTNYKKIEFENLSDPIHKISLLNNTITNTDSFIREHRLFDNVYRVGASQKYDTSTYDFGRVFETDFNNNGQALSSLPKKFVLDLSSPSSLDYYSLLEKEKSGSIGDIQDDFRIPLTGSILYSRSLDYKTKGIDKRINFKKDKPTKEYLSDYAATVTIKDAYDIINAKEIYKSKIHIAETPDINDLVKFRIAVINNESPSESTYMHFRAYIDSFSDSYSSQWDDVNYVGRGEKFYRYTGFNREISLSWTVVAQSKAELAPMYRKLNYLASSLAPYYSKNGYMSGNLVKLTVGGYLYEQPGIITSLTYDVPQESTWEIGIGTQQTDTTGSLDSSVKELPHMIKVTGVKFIPIHEFVPKLFNGTEGNQKEKFIALSDGYGDEKTLYNNIKYSGY